MAKYITLETIISQVKSEAKPGTQRMALRIEPYLEREYMILATDRNEPHHITTYQLEYLQGLAHAANCRLDVQWVRQRQRLCIRIF